MKICKILPFLHKWIKTTSRRDEYVVKTYYKCKNCGKKKVETFVDYL